MLRALRGGREFRPDTQRRLSGVGEADRKPSLDEEALGYPQPQEHVVGVTITFRSDEEGRPRDEEGRRHSWTSVTSSAIHSDRLLAALGLNPSAPHQPEEERRFSTPSGEDLDTRNYLSLSYVRSKSLNDILEVRPRALSTVDE